MTWQMCNWRLIDSPSSVNVNSVDNFIHRLGVIVQSSVLSLVLSGGREQKTTIWSESQSTKEGFQCVVGINVGISHTKSHKWSW